MVLGINHIDKDEFLTIYSSICTTALKQVLSHLNTQICILTPPGTSHSSQASWVTAIPHNICQVELQAEKVKGYMQQCMQGPSSPTN
ncbi:hypothetical protein VTN96DRAFT_4636 [Rasamsonia emersonii]